MWRNGDNCTHTVSLTAALGFCFVHLAGLDFTALLNNFPQPVIH
jgi:hypothetical protein